MSTRSQAGFTVIDLVVGLVALAVIAGVLLVSIGLPVKPKKSANIMKEHVHQRNLIAAAMTYAASNKDWMPGLTSKGQYATADFAGKYYSAKAPATDADSGAGAGTEAINNHTMALMLDDGCITPAQMISPGETGGTTAPTPWVFDEVKPSTTGASAVGGAGEVTRLHFSFALLQYGAPSLKGEWKCNQNQQAVLLGTRVIFTEGATTPMSNRFHTVWTDDDSGHYKGAIVRGDLSVSSESFKAADISSVFGTLKYNQLTTPPSAITFIPSACDATAVGAFGKSGPDLRNFEASAAKGQIGSAND